MMSITRQDIIAIVKDAYNAGYEDARCYYNGEESYPLEEDIKHWLEEVYDLDYLFDSLDD